jgi:hypothetical protein
MSATVYYSKFNSGCQSANQSYNHFKTDVRRKYEFNTTGTGFFSERIALFRQGCGFNRSSRRIAESDKNVQQRLFVQVSD